MRQEFEELIELLAKPVSELIKEQEICEMSDNSLDFAEFQSIHCSGGKND